MSVRGPPVHLGHVNASVNDRPPPSGVKRSETRHGHGSARKPGMRRGLVFDLPIS
jgi:hypothetical protein